MVYVQYTKIEHFSSTFRSKSDAHNPKWSAHSFCKEYYVKQKCLKNLLHCLFNFFILFNFTCQQKEAEHHNTSISKV